MLGFYTHMLGGCVLTHRVSKTAKYFFGCSKPVIDNILVDKYPENFP